MSEEIHKILSLDDRGVPEARDAPAKLFRGFCSICPSSG